MNKVLQTIRKFWSWSDVDSNPTKRNLSSLGFKIRWVGSAMEPHNLAQINDRIAYLKSLEDPRILYNGK